MRTILSKCNDRISNSCNSILQRLGTSSTATQAPTRNAVYRRRRHVAPRDTTRHVPPIDSQTCQMMRGSELHNQPSSMLIYVLRCLSLLLELLLMVVIPTTQFVFSAPLPLRFALAIGLLLVLHFHRLPLPLHQPVNTSLPLRCCRDVRRPNPVEQMKVVVIRATQLCYFASTGRVQSAPLFSPVRGDHSPTDRISSSHQDVTFASCVEMFRDIRDRCICIATRSVDVVATVEQEVPSSSPPLSYAPIQRFFVKPEYLAPLPPSGFSPHHLHRHRYRRRHLHLVGTQIHLSPIYTSYLVLHQHPLDSHFVFSFLHVTSVCAMPPRLSSTASYPSSSIYCLDSEDSFSSWCPTISESALNWCRTETVLRKIVQIMQDKHNLGHSCQHRHW
ncbi:hypothetical protein ECG_00465 [Echinococcus granulosus]|nr:hypothetical protein ECG_00465 [Echinococcus granulosus]